MVSASPEIRFPNFYGINIPTARELIAHGRDIETLRQEIGADALIFQTLDDLIGSLSHINPMIEGFETSIFDGRYLTKES